MLATHLLKGRVRKPRQPKAPRREQPRDIALERAGGAEMHAREGFRNGVASDRPMRIGRDEAMSGLRRRRARQRLQAVQETPPEARAAPAPARPGSGGSQSETARQYAANLERDKAQAKAHYAANKEKRRASIRAWQRAQPTGYNAETVRRWRKNNPEKTRAIARVKEKRRRARKLGQFVENVDHRVVLERSAALCGICGDPVDPADFHVDHIIPLSRGGEDSYANCHAAHPECNVAKGAKLPEEFSRVRA